MIGRDRLYTMSPEDILIEKERIRPYRDAIQSATDKFTPRRERAFTLHELGLKNVQIADEMGVSRHIVGREIKRAEEELREQFTEDGLYEQSCE